MSKADEKKFLIINSNNLILINEHSKYHYSFSSVGLEQLKEFARGIKETQDIIADYYNYLSEYDFCEEIRIEDILRIVDYEEYVKGWLDEK